jgi:hypothetical protein
MSELSFQILTFIALHFFVLATANALVFRFFAEEVRDMFDWFILTFVFFAGEILAVLFTVGFFGYLDIFWVGGLIFGLFLWTQFAFGGFGAWEKLRSVVHRSHVSFKEDGFLGVYGFLILYGVVELFNALIQFPWEYDTIAYHMPFVAEWLANGSLREVFYAVWGGPLGYYPANHELLSFWLVLPFGKDYLVSTLNFGIVLILLVTIYKSLREMKVSSFLSWLAGALVAVMPVFLRQVGTGQVDVFMTLGLILSLYFLFRTFRRQDGLLLAPFLISFSLFLGSKYLSIVYGVPIVLLFLLLYKNWKKVSKWWLVWSLAIVGSLGCAWYWRNLFLTGNPIFPAEVRLGDRIIFEGYGALTSRIQELTLWSRFMLDKSVFWEWFRVLIQEGGWQVYLVFGAYVLLVVEMIRKFLFRYHQKGEGIIFTVLLFLLPAYWYLYFIAPYTASMMEHNVRYAIPWLVFAMIVVAYSVDRVPHFRKLFTTGLVAVVWWEFLSIVTSLRNGQQRFMDLIWIDDYQMLFWFMIGLLALAVLYLEGWKSKRWWRHSLLVVLILSSLSFGAQVVDARDSLRTESWQYKYHFDLFKAYEYIDTVLPEGGVVANTLNPIYYPLYGPSLDRDVVYVNVNDCLKCDYADYHRLGIGVRDNANYWLWRQNMLDMNVDYLVSGYSIKDGLEALPRYEDDWIIWHPEHFEKVFEKGEVNVYRVKDDGELGGGSSLTF